MVAVTSRFREDPHHANEAKQIVERARGAYVAASNRSGKVVSSADRGVKRSAAVSIATGGDRGRLDRDVDA